MRCGQCELNIEPCDICPSGWHHIYNDGNFAFPAPKKHIAEPLELEDLPLEMSDER